MDIKARHSPFNAFSVEKVTEETQNHESTNKTRRKSPSFFMPNGYLVLNIGYLEYLSVH